MNIIDRLAPLIKKIKKLPENKLFSNIVRFLILALCSIYLINNLYTIKTTQIEIKINFQVLALSSVFTLISIFIGAISFYLIMRALMVRMHLRDSMNIHLQSNLAKYIPGYAWQLISKGYLTQNMGISTGMVVLIMTTELIQLVLAGVVLGIFVIPIEYGYRLNLSPYLIQLIPIIRLIVIIIILLSPFYFSYIYNKNKKISENRRISPFGLFASSLFMLIGWIFLGLSFWLIGKALFSISIAQLPFFIFTVVASFLIGLAIIIIPASIGVRESIMVWMLGPIIGSPQAVIVAALSRIIITICELFSAYTFKFIMLALNNPKVVEHQTENAEGEKIKRNS